MEKRIAMTDLDKLKRLYDKATPGPVHAVGVHVEGGTDEETRHIAKCGWEGEAEFYCALRNAFPALVAEIEALRKVRDAANYATDCYFDIYGDNYGKGDKNLKAEELDAMNTLSDALAQSEQKEST